MSNYFPDGRPIQKMMIALSGEAVCIGVTSSITGNIKDRVLDDYSLAKYPNFPTKAAFVEVLDKINLFEIVGGSYSVAGSTNTVTTPDAGQFFTGAQNFQSMNVVASKIVLYIKPTP